LRPPSRNPQTVAPKQEIANQSRNGERQRKRRVKDAAPYEKGKCGATKHALPPPAHPRPAAFTMTKDERRKTKDEGAGDETSPLRRKQTRSKKTTLPPPHSAAERGRQSRQAFELAVRSHGICIYAQHNPQRPPQSALFGSFLAPKKGTPGRGGRLRPPRRGKDEGRGDGLIEMPYSTRSYVSEV